MLYHHKLYLEISPQVYDLSLKRKTIHLFWVLYLKAWTEEEVKTGSMLLQAILKEKKEIDMTIIVNSLNFNIQLYPKTKKCIKSAEMYSEQQTDPF